MQHHPTPIAFSNVDCNESVQSHSHRWGLLFCPLNTLGVGLFLASRLSSIMYNPDVTFCQAIIRKYLAVKKAEALRHDLHMTYATVIQTRWRGHVAIQRYFQCRYCATVLQSAARCRIVRIQCRKIVKGTTQLMICVFECFCLSSLVLMCGMLHNHPQILRSANLQPGDTWRQMKQTCCDSRETAPF